MSKAMIATVTRMVLLTEMTPDPEHLARHTPERVKQLAGDMAANGLHQAIGGLDRKPIPIIYGHGRYAAARLLGWKEIEAKIYPATLTETQWKIIRVAENFQRTDLTGFEKWQACAELMCMNPGWQLKDLAESLNLDPSMVTRLLSPSRCTDAWQEALATGQVGVSDCYAASKLDPEEQAGLLALKLRGASRDQIEQAGRKRRNGTATSVKVSRLRCALPSGVSVQFSGEGIDLETALDAMKDLTAELKRAIDQGLDSKTVVRVLADKAKKG